MSLHALRALMITTGVGAVLSRLECTCASIWPDLLRGLELDGTGGIFSADMATHLIIFLLHHGVLCAQILRRIRNMLLSIVLTAGTDARIVVVCCQFLVGLLR